MQDADEDSRQEQDVSKKKIKRGTRLLRENIKEPVARSVGVAVAGMITRSILGSLGLKSRSRSTKRR
jgi:hypothetical protein